MEFITSNIFDTSTSISVTSGSLSASNILGRNTSLQFVSDGDGNDLTTTTMTITFDETSSVSRMAIMGTNLKDFTIFYNGSTANTFSLTGATTASDWSSNSESSMYLTFDTIQATRIDVDMLSTQVANSEKAIGHIYLADTLVNFDRIPSAKNYKPKIMPKQIVHKLADGGIRLQTTDEKYAARLKIQNIDSSFRDNLKTAYDLRSSFGFVAFPTMTSWDEVFFEAVWAGPFIAYQYSDDAAAAGFTVDIDLKEITRR
jgi:hypothetical protein